MAFEQRTEIGNCTIQIRILSRHGHACACQARTKNQKDASIINEYSDMYHIRSTLRMLRMPVCRFLDGPQICVCTYLIEPFEPIKCDYDSYSLASSRLVYMHIYTYTPTSDWRLVVGHQQLQQNPGVCIRKCMHFVVSDVIARCVDGCLAWATTARPKTRAGVSYWCWCLRQSSSSSSSDLKSAPHQSDNSIGPGMYVVVQQRTEYCQTLLLDRLLTPSTT